MAIPISALLLMALPAPQAAASPTPAVTGHQPAFRWCDADGDGLEDALVLGPDGAVRLLANRGDGGFDDATERAGLAGCGPANDAAWADVDGDGTIDLLLARVAAPALLLTNRGDGTFADATQALGLDALGVVQAATWRDFDRDGRPDLLARTPAGERLLRNGGAAGFAPVDLHLPASAPAVTVFSFLGGSTGSDTTASTTSAPGGPAHGSPGAATGGNVARVALRPASRVGTRTPLVGGGSGTIDTPYGTAVDMLANVVQICAASVEDQADPGTCVAVSSDPLLGSLYPLSTKLYVDADGSVGMGTTSPSAQLDVSAVDKFDGIHAHGFSSSTGGAGEGVEGTGGISTVSFSGDGVVGTGGRGLPPTGSAGVGVRGIGGVANDPGAGVWGTGGFDPTAGTGGPGVRGVGGTGIDGHGVHGSTDDNRAYGVFAENTSVNGEAVLGHATATSGDGAGVEGLCDSPDGYGVRSIGNAIVSGGVLDVVGSPTLATVRIAPDEAVSGDDSQIWFAEDDDADFGMIVRYEGALNRLLVYGDNGGGTLSGPHLSIARDSSNVGIGTAPNGSYALDVGGDLRCVNLVETSDARLKRDVSDLEGCLDAVRALRGVAYTWDAERFPAGRAGRHLGLLAQEVQEVLPDAVRADDEGLLGIDYTALVPVLIEAIHELEAGVVALETRLARADG